jgi:hypothetical protein
MEEDVSKKPAPKKAAAKPAPKKPAVKTTSVKPEQKKNLPATAEKIQPKVSVVDKPGFRTQYTTPQEMLDDLKQSTSSSDVSRAHQAWLIFTLAKQESAVASLGYEDVVQLGVTETSLDSSTVKSYMRTWKMLDDIGIVPGDLTGNKRLNFKKLQQLQRLHGEAGLLTTGSFNKSWRDKCLESGPTSLKVEEIRQLVQKKIGGGKDDRGDQSKASVKLVLSEAGKAQFQDAIGLAKKIGQFEDDASAVAHIVAEWSLAHSQDRAGKLANASALRAHKRSVEAVAPVSVAYFIGEGGQDWMDEYGSLVSQVYTTEVTDSDGNTEVIACLALNEDDARNMLGLKKGDKMQLLGPPLLAAGIRRDQKYRSDKIEADKEASKPADKPAKKSEKPAKKATEKPAPKKPAQKKADASTSDDSPFFSEEFIKGVTPSDLTQPKDLNEAQTDRQKQILEKKLLTKAQIRDGLKKVQETRGIKDRREMLQAIVGWYDAILAA